MMPSTHAEPPPSSGRAHLVLQLLAVAPAAILAASSAVWLAWGGLWPAREVTLVEAAAMRNTAEAARLIGLGHDPNQPGWIGPGLIDRVTGALMTPLEAAVGVRRADMVQMLLDHGAIVEGPQLEILRCYAESRPDPEILLILEGLSPDPWPDCDSAPSARVATPAGLSEAGHFVLKRSDNPTPRT